MKLEINGETYQVPREYELAIFDQLWNKEAVPWYEKLDGSYKVLGMAVSRGILGWLELKALLSGAKKEEVKTALRPPKGTDPNLFMAEHLVKILQEGIQYVTIACETGLDAESGEKRILAFNVQVDAARAQAGLALTPDQSKAG